MTSINAFSPINGEALGEFLVTSPNQIKEKLAAARLAANSWASLSIKQRVTALAPLTALLLNDLDRLCTIISKTTGKVHTEVLLGELYPVLDLLHYYHKNAAKILSDQAVSTSPFAFPSATAEITRKPYGVVAVISPWNFPFQLSIAPMLTALYAGNAVILKPSELSLPVGQLIIELFDKLDLPTALVQWLVGEGATGAQLIDAHPDLVFFTGGLNTGRAVMQRAAQHPIPVILELGGKDPMLVFSDADLERARDAALYGAFSNSGQVCVSVERLYVQKDCFDQFLKLLLEGVAQLKVGHNPEGDLGAMTSAQQIAIVEAHYQDALAQGAQVSGTLNRQGNYLQPVVLWHVHHGMRIMREESFGSLLPVMAFRTEAEAVQLANDSNFGLNASIWTQDMTKAHRVAQQCQVGNWAINDVLKNIGHSGLPFGGMKNSGFGRYHGAEGLLNFTYPVSGLTNRSRLAKEPNWFPYNQQRYQAFKGYFDFVYDDTLRIKSIFVHWFVAE